MCIRREAGLPCVIIDGIARCMDLDYTDEELKYVTDTWTAVYVESDWQIVHPYWICKVGRCCNSKMLYS